MGNHLTFATDGDDIAVPSYTRALDYELELGFVLAHRLRDADPAEAEAAIGGFVVLNDFSARDVQLAEMRSGFGPQKAKHFRSAMSSVVVSADEILPHWRALKGRVHLNGAARRRMRDRRRRALVAGRGARPRQSRRAALSWRVVRHRHAARRQRHRDTAACSTAATPSSSPSTASARSSNRIVVARAA